MGGADDGDGEKRQDGGGEADSRAPKAVIGGVPIAAVFAVFGVDVVFAVDMRGATSSTLVRRH